MTEKSNRESRLTNLTQAIDKNLSIKNKIVQQIHNGLFQDQKEANKSNAGPDAKLLFNINIHSFKFKNSNNFKIHPKIRYRLIYMLNELKHEQTYTIRNTNILNTKLREQFRNDKFQAFGRDCEIELKFKEIKTFARNIRAVRLRNELELQQGFMQNFMKKNSVNVKDALVEILSGILLRLKQNYENQIDLMKSQFDFELITMEKLHFDKIKKLQKSIDQTQCTYENEFKALDMALIRKKDEQYTKSSNQILSLKFEYEKKFTQLNEKFLSIKENENYFQKYFDNYLILIKQNEQYNMQFIASENQIKKYECKIRFFTEKLQNSSNLTINNGKLNYLRQNYFQKSNELKKIRKISYNSITSLCSTANQCLNELKRKLKIAENIIKLMEICQKNAFKYTIYDYGSYKLYENLACLDYASVHMNNTNENLVNFYKKFNLLNLQVYVLKKENQDLINENNSLKQELKGYFEKLKNPPSISKLVRCNDDQTQFGIDNTRSVK